MRASHNGMQRACGMLIIIRPRHLSADTLFRYQRPATTALQTDAFGRVGVISCVASCESEPSSMDVVFPRFPRCSLISNISNILVAGEWN